MYTISNLFDKILCLDMYKFNNKFVGNQFYVWKFLIIFLLLGNAISIQFQKMIFFSLQLS